MKHLILKGISLSCLAAVTLGACNTAKKEEAPVIDKEAIKKEIQAKENEFADRYNKGELRDIGYYADDAVTYFQNRPPLVGKAEIAKYLIDDILSNTDKITFETKEVFVSNDGVMVLEIGHFTVVDSANVELNSGHYMSYFEKRNGKYVAVRDMSASDKPPR